MTHLRHAADRTETLRTPDGAELRVHVRGSDRPRCTVLLAHGWGFTSDTWAAQASRLAAGSGGALRVVRWDHRGHGGSGRGTAPITMDLLAEDLALVAAETAARGPVVLGGHSLGGMAITALAAARPELFGDRVAGVLLAAATAGGLDTTGPGFPLPERAGGAAVGAVMWTLRTVPGPIEAVRRIAAPHSGLWRAAVRRGFFGPDARIADVAACAQQMHAVPADVLGEYHAALVRHDVRDRLKALHRVPVTVLTGGYDRMIAPSHAQDLCRALPGARPHTVDRAGHMLPVEAPEKVSALLAELCGVDLAPL
ncbi:alpha/beta fold hydrolase [Nocardiopsis composta]|uniref:Pimeloyl-ACP methyl ester carboxylesterase n=1 Tax=Nocardiopsis composta TaxID=157465 RepID=A0A7W8VGF9_9ACTN|nr:alpha/beta hydrolase [Nocardiopsis composta]MBB5434949.1 pimeloyl-ACP methyl ester carboxylesterase [Nocardiopsis composta]